MFHVRRELTKAEKAEYRRWQEKHRSQIRSSILKPTKSEQAESAKAFWQKQAKVNEQVMRGTPTCDEVPRPDELPGVTWVENAKPELDTQEEQEAWEAREAAAAAETREKQLRTAPVYNKGGAQYWSEGMIEDLKTGGHRRRS